jgi:extracellular factor (EF) 3-hydroxypalmitic acid methyl ester biosynthesis protein
MDTMIKELNDNMDQKDSGYLAYLVSNGGPELEDYKKFTSVVNSLQPEDIASFRDCIMSALNENTLIGHGFVKPFGYPGDFTLIEKIYQFSVNEDIRYKNWDLFFQNQPGAHAVRNRKKYFLDYCKKLVKTVENPKILILGSGPATDVHEFLSSYKGDNKITFDLVDLDQTAIDFSMEKNREFGDTVSYIKINALRYNSFKLYDFIWSAGLFDYFKDKHFIFLVKKYMNCLTEIGELVIGNFSTKNPTKRLMEVLSDWYLNHRTESDLFRIAYDAGADSEMVSLEKEPLGINLFLKIRKPK